MVKEPLRLRLTVGENKETDEICLLCGCCLNGENRRGWGIVDCCFGYLPPLFFLMMVWERKKVSPIPMSKLGKSSKLKELWLQGIIR